MIDLLEKQTTYSYSVICWRCEQHQCNYYPCCLSPCYYVHCARR